METKKCNKCGNIKAFSEFYKKKNTKDGYRFQCISCIEKYTIERKKLKAEYDKNYRKKNKEKLKKQHKEYQENNKEKIAKQKKEYCLNHKEEKAKYDKEYANKNKEIVTENKRRHYENNKELYKQRAKENREANKEYYVTYCKRYREEHKEEIAEKQSLYVKNNRAKINARLNERRRTDPNFNIMCKLRARITKVLKRNNGKKAYSSIELIGMPIDEYKDYLKSTMYDNMTWDDFLNGDVHLDHIIPCVVFDLTNSEEQKKCFHWSNTQLLWAKDNLEKGDRLDWSR